MLNPLCYMFVLYFIYFCSHIHFFLHSTFFGFILLFLFLFCNHWDGCLVNSFLPIPFLFYFLFFNFFFTYSTKGLFTQNASVSQSVQLLSHVPLFVTPWDAGCQTSLSITNSTSLLRFMSITWWNYPTISSSVVPFSYHLQSFPASGSFQMSQLFAFFKYYCL